MPSWAIELANQVIKAWEFRGAFSGLEAILLDADEIRSADPEELEDRKSVV